MNIIQAVLIALLLLLVYLYFYRFRNASYDKVVVLLLAISGILFVIKPDLTNRLAKWMGVGRGADLLFYFAIVAGGFLFLLFYSKIKKIEKNLTEIVRQMSILQSQLTEKSHNKHV